MINVMKKYTSAFLLFNLLMMQAQTQIIAHRGYWQTKPETTENSLQALENAQKLNIYGTEFDVRMSKDVGSYCLSLIPLDSCV